MGITILVQQQREEGNLLRLQDFVTAVQGGAVHRLRGVQLVAHQRVLRSLPGEQKGDLVATSAASHCRVGNVGFFRRQQP